MAAYQTPYLRPVRRAQREVEGLVVRSLLLHPGQTELELEPVHHHAGCGGAGGLRSTLAASLFTSLSQRAPGAGPDAEKIKNQTNSFTVTKQGGCVGGPGRDRAAGSRTDSVQKVQRKCAQVQEKCT